MTYISLLIIFYYYLLMPRSSWS